MHTTSISACDQTENVQLEAICFESKWLIKPNKKNLEEYLEVRISNPKEFYSYVDSRKVLISGIESLVKEDGNHKNTESEMVTFDNNSFRACIYWSKLYINPDSLYQTLKKKGDG